MKGKNMKGCLLIFLTAGMANACPAHPGYIMNGTVEKPVELKVNCGPAYTAFTKGMVASPNNKWTELYTVQSVADSSLLAHKIRVIMENKGFLLAYNKTDFESGRILGYINNSSRKIIFMYIFLEKSIVYTSFAGN
ncbi:hypothetical protein Q0M94_22880 (plasmid) [Deinococcus radiomollis]|uniref:hypothetical protein n=1 Tax=Deinococcus radiomollis TaxID=468916 RepID=UPI0038929EC4